VTTNRSNAGSVLDFSAGVTGALLRPVKATRCAGALRAALTGRRAVGSRVRERPRPCEEFSSQNDKGNFRKEYST
jgi:hypothetical protein